MPTGNEPYVLEDGGWTVRVRAPQTDAAPRTLLLIHGWKGDETVMWIFTARVPGNYWLFAPRAPLPSPDGDGYGWILRRENWPALSEFADPAASLIGAVDHWGQQTGAPVDSFDVMGFSQGAAMAYALGAFYPQRVSRVLALAGFLPDDVSDRYRVYQGKPVYIAHGSRDETVPVQKAEEAVETLQSYGADVTYCSSDIGHKLSAECLRGLEAFLK